LEPILGIDIATATFHAVLLRDDEKPLSKNFANTMKGFAQLDASLKNRKATCVRGCLEATNSYWKALAYHLRDGDHQVAVVNPSRPNACGQSERPKNDAVHAALLAGFCRSQRPARWTPPAQKNVQGLVRRFASVMDMRQRT